MANKTVEEKNITARSVWFNLDDPRQKEMLEFATNDRKFSAFIKELIRKEIEGNGLQDMLAVLTRAMNSTPTKQENFFNPEPEPKVKEKKKPVKEVKVEEEIEVEVVEEVEEIEKEEGTTSRRRRNRGSLSDVTGGTGG